MKTVQIARLTLALLVTGTAWAQDYPAKPIRLIVPYPAGSSSNDIIARVLADRLSAQGAEPMVMEPNKFSEFLRVETDKWAKVVKGANLKLD